ncbi:MAG: RnfABCDGE type electron transport complex subunit B [Intestinibacter sp.]
MEILKSVILLGVMGLIFGAVLAFAAQKFAVKVDEREAKILEVLPGANCGGCGYPGCGGVAAAIAKGEAPVNACPVGGAAVAAKVGEIMGVSAEAGEKMVAHVMCKGTCSSAANKYEYQGIADCRAAISLIGGPKDCSFGCIGLGTCVSACGFGGIKIVDGVAVVDEDQCVLCGKCIEACPKGIIGKKPASKKVVVDCSSKDPGKVVKAKCSAGCIGCKACEKACPVGAITVENNIATIDYSKCIGCKECAVKCPKNVISAGDISDRRKVAIDEQKCIGCTACARVCPFGAIEGDKKQPHKVDLEKCKGCHLCMQKCKKDAIKCVEQ